MAALTVKVAVLEPVPSHAVTLWRPTVAAGIRNAQPLKRPLASVVQGMPPSAVAGTLLPPKVKAMVLYGMKPLPFTAAMLSTRPARGVRLMARVTVKVVLPEYVPSDTVTV
jgi:hypothetical protein